MSVNELKQYRLKKSILSQLYKYGTFSVPELGKKLGISIPTTLVLLNDLIIRGLVNQRGPGISSGGRKPSMYGLSEESLYVIACDMGHYQAKMTIVNCHNQRMTPISFIETHINDNQLVDKLFESAGKLIEDYHIPDKKIVGLGVDMPGLVDANRGYNYFIKEKQEQNIREKLQQKFNMMVYVDNDARMQAFGEYMFGKAKGCQNALVINWSWGLGLGMILNDRLYGGITGFAGEFSHIQMVDNGELCACGKRGCLETVASSDAILKLAKEGINNGIISQLTRQFGENPENLTPEDVISAAKLGDEFSISILNKIGLVFGKGLSYLIQLLNPEIIVLAGPVARANQFVLIPIQQALNKYCLEQIVQKTTIVISEIDEQAGMMGTAAMLFQHIFSDMTT